MQIFPFFLLIAGFILLIKGGVMLVDGAASFARRMNASDAIVGLTIVSFGTSIDELVLSIIAVLQGSADLAVGIVFGSGIANIFLILGVCALLFPLTVRHSTIQKEIPLLMLAVLLIGALANRHLFDGGSVAVISRTDGIVLLIFFLVFLHYIFQNIRTGRIVQDKEKTMSLPRSISYFILGVGALIIGGTLVVDSGTEIADTLGVTQSFIGLTFIAIGSSLPELVVSSIAAWKRKADIAVGNIIGSNLFNILFVLGAAATITPITYAARNNADLLILLAATILLVATAWTGKRRYVIEGWNGIIALVLYTGYLAFTIFRG